MGTLGDEIIKWPFGVAASLVATVMGYWIWRSQRRLETRTQSEQYRRDPYREVWTTLQAAEIVIRGTADRDLASLDSLIRDVNAVLTGALAPSTTEIAIAMNDFLVARENVLSRARNAQSGH